MWKRTLREKVRGYFALITRGRFRKSTNSSAEFADTYQIWPGQKKEVRLRCHCHSNLKMSKQRQKIV